MEQREREIREAREAGVRALESLEEAKDSLGSARGWGIFDLLGGGAISGFLKHSKIQNAKDCLNEAKRDLERFGRELSDVQDIQGLNLEIGDFLTFADFFFDGFLADVMVQSRIRETQREIDDAISRVKKLLRRLEEY